MDEAKALYLAEKYDIPLDVDYHVLNSVTVERVLNAAREHKYRKPKNANGSKGRYFHAFLCRVANK